MIMFPDGQGKSFLENLSQVFDGRNSNDILRLQIDVLTLYSWQRLTQGVQVNFFLCVSFAEKFATVRGRSFINDQTIN